MTPVVGVTTWRRPLDTVVAAAQPLYTLGVDYVERLGAAGLVVLLLPVLDDDGVSAVINRIDGLVLSGGQDVDPGMYGQQPAGSVDVDREVDESEVRLARAARARRLPVLGICRGLQVLNVALGGTLHQEVTGRSPAHPTRPEDRSAALAHRHVVGLDGRLAAIYGDDRREVTSLHHQAVDRLAEPLRVAARADDDGVEGVESGDDGWWAVGVQWHPEKVGVHEQPLFDAFAAAVLASAVAGSRL